MALDFFKKERKFYTISQKIHRIRIKFRIFIVTMILLTMGAITLFAFEFSRVTKLTYNEIANQRISNTGNERETVLHNYFTNCFSDMHTFDNIASKKLNALGDTISHDTIQDSLEDINIPYSLSNLGIIYNNQAIFKKAGESGTEDCFDISMTKITIDNKITKDMIFKGSDINSTFEDDLYIIVPTKDTNSKASGFIGRISKEKADTLLSTTIYNGESTTLIVDRNGYIVYYTSLVHKWRFDGSGPYGWPNFTNLTYAMSIWVDEEGYNRFVEYMKEDEDLVYNIGEGDRDGMFYKVKLCYGDTNEEYFLIFMAPKNLLINTTETLTRIIISVLFSVLVLGLIVVSFLSFIIEREYIHRKFEQSFDKNNHLHLVESFFKDAQAILIQSPKQSFGIIHVNIQDFKKINNYYGSDFGDTIIQEVGALLYEKYNESLNELAGYNHGDNYMLLLAGNEEEILYKLTDLNYSLTEHHFANDQKLKFSYGVKMTDYQYSLDLHTEYDHAKHANQARKSKDIFSFYNDEMVRLQKDEEDLNGRFDEAIRNEEFEVFLQLKWDLKKNDWAGAEALCRWRDPIKGLISPGKFIPLFEENGKIVKLDEYMFEQTCKIISKMIENNERCVPVSFNLSKRNFQDLSFIEKYQEIIERYKIPHELIEIEITEGLLVDNVESFTSFIKIFHENDFNISMDDFGTGYSSLNMIHQLDFDVIKIDAKFFRDGLDDANKTIVSSIISLCHNLDKIVVAEGIEQANEVEFLRKVGCDIIQGYYFAKPLPVDEFKQLLFSKPKNA